MKRSRFFYLFFLFLIFVGAYFYFVPRQKQSQLVVFCNVGEGDGILIKDNTYEVVIDAGSKGGKMVQCLQKYLSFDDKKIEKIIISHYDSDHLGGFSDIFSQYEIGEIYGLGKTTKQTETYLEWQKNIQKLGKSEQILIYGMIIKTQNAKIEVLYPFYNSDYSIVNLSDVLRLDFLGKKFLFDGDLELKSWQDLINHRLDLGADILKISHHGSKNGTNVEILEQIRPKEVVISVGKNKYGHPAEEIIKLLENQLIRIHRTDKEGDIVYK